LVSAAPPTTRAPASAPAPTPAGAPEPSQQALRPAGFRRNLLEYTKSKAVAPHAERGTIRSLSLTSPLSIPTITLGQRGINNVILHAL
jgi:hypothetical protein